MHAGKWYSIPKPNNITYDEAASIPYGAINALSFLRKLSIKPGQKVLVNGASAGIGSFMVQLAKYFGAIVTGVCSTNRMDFVKSLGADKVIDYTKEDFTGNSEKYDIILDILGKSSFSKCKNSLTENGRVLYVSFKTKKLFQMLLTSLTGKKKVICALSSEKPEELVFIKNLIEEGKLKSIVDKRFPLAQTADAHRYVEEGHKKGSVVMTVKHYN